MAEGMTMFMQHRNESHRSSFATRAHGPPHGLGRPFDYVPFHCNMFCTWYAFVDDSCSTRAGTVRTTVDKTGVRGQGKCCPCSGRATKL